MDIESNNEHQKSFRDFISILKRRRKLVWALIGIIFTLYFTALFFWSPTYQSKAVILIEEQEVPVELIQTTVTSYAIQRIEEIKQRIMTNTNIMGIVERFKLLNEREMKRLTRSEIAAEFRKNVAITPISADVIDPRSGQPTQATIAFEVAFKGDQINTVHKVTNELVTLLLNENLKERTEQSENTAQFLRAEAETLDAKLKEYEEKISEFKKLHSGSLPELQAFNLNVVDRGHQEILSIQTRIQELESRKLSLAAELLQLDKSAPKILSNGETILSPAERLKSLKSEYAYKKSVYTQAHPQLKRLEREIASLTHNASQESKQALAEQIRIAQQKLAAAQQKYQPHHPNINALARQLSELKQTYQQAPDDIDSLPDNPSYVLVATQLDGVNSEMASLMNKMAALEDRIAQYEGYLIEGPMVEKTYHSLLRDYENTAIKHREISAKRMTAELANNLEQDRKGERFTLIQPPEIPERPISPNIKAMTILGIILSLGLGALGALIAENIDPKIYGQQKLTKFIGVEPLVTIPIFYTHTAVHPSKHLWLWLFALGILGIFAATGFHVFIKPIDVTWFLIARKLGMDF